MKISKNLILRTFVTMVLLFVACTASITAAPLVITDSTKYVRYTCVDAGINIVLPEDWTYETEYSQEGYYTFFGPEITQSIEITYNTLAAGNTVSVDNIAELYYAVSVDEYNYLPLSRPSILQFGDKFGMICAYAENIKDVVYIMVDIMCIIGNKFIMITIIDEINSFVEKVEQYDVVVSSVMSNPSSMGILEKLFSGIIPGAEILPATFIQSN